MSESPIDREPFVVLMVCSGNVCRSPIAEQLLRARLDPAESVQVVSAGTVAVSGEPMTEPAQTMSRRFGGTPDGHRATPLTRDMVAASGLILTATREHRAAAVTMLARSSSRAFTLKQFARLADAATDELVGQPDIAERIAIIGSLRGIVAPVAPEEDDIDDPFLSDIPTYERVAAEIDQAVTMVVRALIPETVPPPPGIGGLS